MNCMASIVKYILYIFNIIFLICGILLIVLGSIMLSDLGSISSVDDAINTKTIPILILTLGCIVFVISFFGCCGAIRENSCCMTIYAVFMFIIFVLQITLVVWIFVKRQEFLNTMSSLVDTAWNQNDAANNYPMDALQVAFKCCGKNSYADYTAINKPVPVSCCGSLDATTCPANVYQKQPGCQYKFVDFWSSNTNIIRYAGIGVAVVELVAFTFACCLATSMRRSRGHNL